MRQHASGWFRDTPVIKVGILKSLTHKIQRSEKRILIGKGLHPRKDRTYNLINYMDLLDDKELELLVTLVNDDRGSSSPIHAGIVPFLKRDYVLNVIYDNTKKSLSGRLRGTHANITILDDVTPSRLDVKQLREVMKQVEQRSWDYHVRRGL